MTPEKISSKGGPVVLTVVIRDETPMRYIGEPCRYRTAHVELTPEQQFAIRFRNENEAVNQCFIETLTPTNSRSTG